MQNSSEIPSREKTNICRALESVIDSHSIPHASLFEGEHALENALYLAKSVVCTSENDAPCNKCVACKKADDKNHPDIIVLSAKKPNNPYPVDFIREIRTQAYIAPNEAKCKVYIFTESDKISPASQNAMLKILEEPPITAVFAFCCNKKELLLDTVISRVSVFICGAKQVNSNSEAAKEADELAQTAFTKNEYFLLAQTFPLIKERAELLSVLTELQSLFRCMYLVKLGIQNDDVKNNVHLDTANMLCEKITVKAILRLEKAVIQTQNNLQKNGNAQLCVTRLCALIKSVV